MKRLLCLLALVAALTSSALAAPVGMITHLLGRAEMRAGQGDWKPVRLMTRLDVGDSVRCAADSAAVITVFATAEQYTVAASATVTVEARSVRGAQKSAGIQGSGVQIARSMVGDRPNGFFARPAQTHQRLSPTYPGWIVEGERHFAWTPVDRAASYAFTLFDQNDNVVWSQRVNDPKADYPGDLPYFALRRPYVWRLTPFGGSGKPLPEARWGIVTFLSQKDADQLTADARDLEAQAKTATDNVTALVLLAELYRSYGVLEKTLEVLERPELEQQVGIKEAQEDAYSLISRYAQMLHSPAVNTATAP